MPWLVSGMVSAFDSWGFSLCYVNIGLGVNRWRFVCLILLRVFFNVLIIVMLIVSVVLSTIFPEVNSV